MYIRKTDDIWTDIKQQIANLFSERRTHAANWYRYGIEEDEFNRICLEAVVSAEQRALMDKLGDQFFKKRSSLKVRLQHPDNNASRHADTYTISFKEACCLPAHWDSYESSDWPIVSDARIANISINRKNAMRAISDEQEKLEAVVKKVWITAASVNNFVKLWPPGRDLLPTSVINKLDEKAARSGTSKPVIDTSDLTALNSNLLKAKVAA